ncbi:MAG: glycosyltransferase family 9 protein [Desulfobacca sp.]|uniref:glycosyltransferase family 9 protein n=1 Tax=Desulfobacca sp. TaxID=2067990 RepID=UPI00404B3226
MTRILLIKLSALGDVLQTLPTLEALHAAYPEAEISWLVEEAAAPVLQRHPALASLLISRRQTWLRAVRTWRGLPVAWREGRQLWQALRRQPFDAVIDLQGLGKSALWTWLARSPRKIGFAGGREGSSLVLTDRLPPYDPDEHAVRRYLRLAEHLGAVACSRFRLALPPAAGQDLAPLWTGGAGPLLILHPGTRWPSKHWPPVLWAQLADALGRVRGARIVFTGSAADRPLIARIRAAMRGEAVDLSGRTELPALARLFFQADAAVTTDTGPMHLAAAVGTPVAAIFGPTAPWRTGPYGCQHRVVLIGVACSPCRQRRCPDPVCLTELPVDMVLNATLAVLDQDPGLSRRTLSRQVVQGQEVDIIEHVALTGETGDWQAAGVGKEGKGRGGGGCRPGLQ